MPDSSTWTFGPATLRFEPPDLVLVTVSEGHQDQVEAFYKTLGGIADKNPVFMIIDARRMAKMDAAARLAAVRHVKVEWFRGVVYVGASLAVRIGVKGVSALLFVTGKDAFETVFVDSIDKARTTVDRMRQERRA